MCIWYCCDSWDFVVGILLLLLWTIRCYGVSVFIIYLMWACKIKRFRYVDCMFVRIIVCIRLMVRVAHQDTVER